MNKEVNCLKGLRNAASFYIIVRAEGGHIGKDGSCMEQIFTYIRRSLIVFSYRHK